MGDEGQICAETGWTLGCHCLCCLLAPPEQSFRASVGEQNQTGSEMEPAATVFSKEEVYRFPEEY